MRSVLFILVLVLHAWGVLDMHSWLKVPSVIAHVLEHHSDLGHHDPDGEGHQHDDIPDEDHDHTPFDSHDDALCNHAWLTAVLPSAEGVTYAASERAVRVGGSTTGAWLDPYSGSKWNPPKLG